MGKSVALVGFAPNTIDKVYESEADEIWSLAWAYKYDLPRIDRLFEMHPLHLQARTKKPMYVKPRAHLAYLRKQETFDVYMLDDHDDVPRSVRYPIEDVTELLLSRWTRSDEPMHIFTSSMDYMMALAIHEGFDTVELIGVEMSSDSEYRYQREGFCFWAGYTLGRGMALKQHAPSQLLYKPKRYGYDGFQMIYRQDLERLMAVYKKDYGNTLARLQYLEGQFKVAQSTVNEYKGKDKSYRAHLEEVRNELGGRMEKTRTLTTMNASGLKVVSYLLKEIDLEEDNSPTMEDPFSSIEVERNNESVG